MQVQAEIRLACVEWIIGQAVQDFDCCQAQGMRIQVALKPGQDCGCDQPMKQTRHLDVRLSIVQFPAPRGLFGLLDEGHESLGV